MYHATSNGPALHRDNYELHCRSGVIRLPGELRLCELHMQHRQLHRADTAARMEMSRVTSQKVKLCDLFSMALLMGHSPDRARSDKCRAAHQVRWRTTELKFVKDAFLSKKMDFAY